MWAESAWCAVLAALLSVVGADAFAQAPLQAPLGYTRPVSVTNSKPISCAPPPAPFTETLDFPSKYEGSGETRDELNPEADAEYRARTLPITEMEKGVSGNVTSYMKSGNASQLQCVMDWLSSWATARALLGEATTHTGKSLRKWALGSLSGAYLRLKFSSSSPLSSYPDQARRIEAWFGDVADRVALEWSPQDPLRKINNHYYWAAWAMSATAVVTNRRDLFDKSLALYRVFAGQVDAEGYLPNELARGSKAASYHAYALLPIAMVVALGKANGVNLPAENAGALARFAERVRVTLNDPSSIAARAGAAQSLTESEIKSLWVWLEPYCWAVACGAELRKELVARRPMASTRLGGNLTAVYGGAKPMPPGTVSGIAALNGMCKERIGSEDYEGALRVCKRVRFDVEKIAPGSKEHIESLVNLGDIKILQEDYVDADAYYTAALTLLERAPAAEPAQVSALLQALVEIKVKRGQVTEAEPLMKRALEIQENANTPASKVAVLRARYADLLAETRQFLEAEQAYKQAITVLERDGPGTREALALAFQRQGEMYERRAMVSHAESSYRRLLEVASLGSPGNASLVTALDRLAHLCEDQGRPVEARKLYQREMLALLVGPGMPLTAAKRVRERLAALEPAPTKAAAAEPVR
jgi:poly(beta-D-mannuronate) lyase